MTSRTSRKLGLRVPPLFVQTLEVRGDVNTTPAFVQVIEVCRRANARLVVKRARFSALVRAQLERAVAQLVEPDEAASRAVDARQEIDLRIGASFTRFQTLLLQVPVCWSLSCPLLCLPGRQGHNEVVCTNVREQLRRTSLTSVQPARKEIVRNASLAMDPANSRPWG